MQLISEWTPILCILLILVTLIIYIKEQSNKVNSQTASVMTNNQHLDDNEIQESLVLTVSSSTSTSSSIDPIFDLLSTATQNDKSLLSTQPSIIDINTNIPSISSQNDIKKQGIQTPSMNVSCENCTCGKFPSDTTINTTINTITNITINTTSITTTNTTNTTNTEPSTIWLTKTLKPTPLTTSTATTPSSSSPTSTNTTCPPELIDSEQEEPDDPGVDYTELRRLTGAKPRRPLEGDCCGEGCVHCVFDVYDTRIERWRERRRKALLNLKENKL